MACEATAASTVFKMGRTTGATAGTVNGCRAVTCFYASERDPVHSTELAIIPFRPDSPATFAHDGDSGALVHNARGEGELMVWGRMLQGGQPLLEISWIAFATPLVGILQDIKATVEKMNPGQSVEVVML